MAADLTVQQEPCLASCFRCLPRYCDPSRAKSTQPAADKVQVVLNTQTLTYSTTIPLAPSGTHKKTLPHYTLPIYMCSTLCTVETIFGLQYPFLPRTTIYAQRREASRATSHKHALSTSTLSSNTSSPFPPPCAVLILRSSLCVNAAVPSCD